MGIIDYRYHSFGLNLKESLFTFPLCLFIALCKKIKFNIVCQDQILFLEVIKNETVLFKAAP